MPFTHLEIKQQKAMSIILLFAMLVAVYFAGTWFVIIVAKVGLIFLCPEWVVSTATYSVIPGRTGNLWIFGAALIGGLIHWLVSTNNLLPRISLLLGATPPDKDDTYHQRFKNIVEELSVAAGGRKIDCAVIPTTAVNSFSLADFHGHALIGVTEGLLARLTRRQIEAVAAHEAGHIISGDCLTSTVSCSLFGMYAAAFQYITTGIEGSVDNAVDFQDERKYGEQSSAGIFIPLYVILVGCAIGITAFLSMIINTLISRQKEYRADALSVELTRDPLSLAEALRIISGSWCGAGQGIENLDSVFIANPAYEEADEREGFIPDLLSTHPPMSKRISLLLGMAHAGIHALDNCQKRDLPSETGKPAAITAPRWFVSKDGAWLGPFDINGLISLSWFSPDTWIKVENEDRVKLAFEDIDIAAWFNKGNLTPLKCPSCGLALVNERYEGAPVYTCAHQHGFLVDKNHLMRIIARKDIIFAPEVLKLADTVVANPEQARAMAMSSESIKNKMLCPKCGNKMDRRCYSMAYPVLVDVCKSCNTLWFEKYEMELLQILIEKNESCDRKS
ncbi:MAG: zinc metalloprotease HtpX [bacterium]|nr:zinc metalloprotease HtpX [bacterium]